MLKKLPKRACPELAEGFNRSFIVGLSDPTKLWLLYAVLFIQCVCKYAGEMREIYSFLALAKRGKGNALFVFSLVEALDKIQNVHFPLRRAFFFVF